MLFAAVHWTLVICQGFLLSRVQLHQLYVLKCCEEQRFRHEIALIYRSFCCAGPHEPPMIGHIHDLGKGTVAQGEDCFPGGQLLITDCRDANIYALAPLNLAKISSCTDCVIVVGAVSGCLHIEDSARVHLIAACRRIYISSCYDCVLNLGTNRPPVFCGDNRFVKLAPYNTGYERLPLHLETTRISKQNLWDQPLFLKSVRGSMDLDQQLHGSGVRADTPERTGIDHIQAKKVLLPPDKLSPFTIPFRGGPGLLAGGAVSSSGQTSHGRGSRGSGATPRQGSSPFALPSQYADAMVKKLRKVAELQGSVGKVSPVHKKVLECLEARDELCSVCVQFCHQNDGMFFLAPS